MTTISLVTVVLLTVPVIWVLVLISNRVAQWFCDWLFSIPREGE